MSSIEDRRSSGTTDVAIVRLERVLQKGWVWEAGNYPREIGYRAGYWAQAIGPEINHKHPIIDAFGPQLFMTLDALRLKVLESSE